jgi:sugar phosphate isomerase/epimerase
MRLSCLPVSYFPMILSGEMSLGAWVREGAALGLDAVDVSILFLKNRDTAYLGSLRRQVEQAGIPLCGASTYPDFTHPDQAERARELARFKIDLEALAAIGVRIVRITAGQAHPGLDPEEGIGRVLAAFEQAVTWARACGLELVFENHSKPGAWRYPDFSFSTRVFTRIADELRGTPIHIQFDTANPIVFGDDPLPVLERVIGRVRVVHAADTRTWGGLDPAVIGTGLVPFSRIFRRLADSGYDHWISIEEASGTGPRGVAAAVGFVRSAWAAAGVSEPQKSAGHSARPVTPGENR